jgi:prepilin-type processing-associated H-X9-DG protein
MRVRDARTIMPQVIQHAQSCMQAIVATPGTNSNRGVGGATGSPGVTLASIISRPTRRSTPARPADGTAARAAATSTSSRAHPGGVDVLFLDGSVRFAKDSINQNTRLSLGSRDGEEVVSSDSS